MPYWRWHLFEHFGFSVLVIKSALHYCAPMMHVLRKFVATMLALSLLLISSVPLVSAATCDMPNMDMNGMNMKMNMAMQIEPVTPQVDVQDCCIECGCRIHNDLNGMPHQLAPHALSQAESEVVVNMADIDMADVPTLIARHLFFPPPPPIIS